jgi:PKD repeat protein
MTAEGQSYALDQWLDASELMGDVTGTIQWGDGTSSPATIAAKPAAGPLRVRIDYSLDANNFFQANERRVLLQTVLDSIASRFSDSLSAIQPQGSEYWEARFKNPSNGADVSRRNLPVAANELVVFVGARALSVGEGGLGNRGGTFVSSTRQQFVDTVRARGQTGALANPATDVGPWGGAITFDTTKNWYFGTDPNGMGSNQLDFVTVAAHEFLHVLGFGTTDSFNNKLINNKFTGTAARAEYGSDVPMADPDHFANNLSYRGRRPIMVPSLGNAERLLPSRLDLTAMHDIGWRLITPSVRVTGSKVFGDNANFSATITLQGARIGSKSFPLSVPITNVAPTFDTRGNATAIAGFPVTLNRIGQFSDPGFGTPLTSPPKSETFTYRIQWGDNTSDTGNATVESVGNTTTRTRGYFNGTHTYANPGTYTVTLTVTDDDGGSSQQQFQITVAEQPKLTLAINKNTFSESAGAGVALLTISRPAGSTSAALVVQLRSNDTSEATLPATTTIPAGATSVSVGVNAVDDALFDGSQTVELSASATSFQPGALNVSVTDHQPISLAAANTALHEDIPEQRSTRVTVGIRSPAPAGGVRVTLAATPPGVLQIPTTVTIPAGSTQIDVTVSAIDDLRPQRLRNVTLNASGDNLIASTLNLTVNDSDPYRWTNPNVRVDVDANGSVDPLDVLRIINEINRAGTRALDPVADVAPPYFDTNPDGTIDPLDVLVVINEINRRA